MATYNLDQCQLDSLLDRYVSRGTEDAIFQALKGADLLPHGHGTLGVETQSDSGTYKIPMGDDFFLDVGQSNSIILKSHGGVVIGAGDGANSILDKGPGGDTLVGGAGAEKLEVTRGDNVLIGGGGLNTLIGGTGDDVLIGGGKSLLEAGSGDSTLMGGSNFDYSQGAGDDHGRHHGGSDDHGRHRDGRGGDDDRRGGDHGRGDDHHQGQTFSMDTLVGGSGDDLMKVYHGDNVIYAGTGHDTIYAGDGSDTIYGSTNPTATHAMDTIYLGTGDTSIQGGAAGAATIFAGMHGNDTVTGSAHGQALSLYSEQSTAGIKSMTESGGVTTITFKDHQSLSLDHVTVHFSNGPIMKV
ncbi:hypothetical protein K9U39_07120 [Rhodoblastus acidophilus]|uniref:Calcium-binding protein n=1 Tax=Candidatus Rhodoblastus alkanivorans TaxID=2954117 RepID=A0ABS9Z9V4_9HYPH|nr:hypothetical protein [Candidatus Rhodoblastus alkanivorans]MCI4679582.1 hypothetical protein [Candidatus Rhodoblastus alkanivorans]MCI4683407.1 hypothetical protein [Candidatus Rhodoblastus alkanivorans]MDI4640717.1 hypothetical protein [Rhodoblastus acidophilus]